MVTSGERLLIDTNILLLLVVGRTDPDQIIRFKRTRDRFDRDDYDRLLDYMRHFRVTVTTPHILTEASNLLAAFHGTRLHRSREVFARIVRFVTEHIDPASELVARPQFVYLGLTDVGIIRAATPDTTVLTDDAVLAAALLSLGRNVRNFNQLRD